MDLITQIYSSIFRLRAYQYFKEQNFSRAFLYLVVISLLFGSFGLIETGLGFSRAVDQLTAVYQEKFPEFLLKNGELKISGKMPLVLFEDQRSIFVIDTSGQVDEAVLADFEEGCFITKESVRIKNHRQVRQFYFKDYQQLFFNKERLARVLPQLKWLMVTIFFFGEVWILVAMLFNALILTLLGFIPATLQKKLLKFGELYKMSIYALTLPAVLQGALQAGGLVIPAFFLFYYGIALVYLSLGIRALKSVLPQ